MQHITFQQKNTIITNFQKLKLSYDNNVHKKVCGIPRSYMNDSNDIYCLIPKGSKFYVWFTSIEDKRVCVFINSFLQKKNVFIYPIQFDKHLSLNTVLYGTLHYLKESTGNNKIFTIEDMLMYKGYDLRTQTEQYRISSIISLLGNDLPDNMQHKTNIKISPCHMSFSYDELLQNYNNGHFYYLAYSIQKRHTLQSFKLDRRKDSTVLTNVPNSSSSSHSLKNIMDIQADIKCDVYHLYKDSEYIGVADIPDYKTSVMMNRLFRHIKENDNLDALEESDEEEEFQDISDEKFMKKNTIIKMDCKYNHKTKRYIPLRST